MEDVRAHAQVYQDRASREAATKAVLSRVMAIFNPGGKLGSSSAIFSDGAAAAILTSSPFAQAEGKIAYTNGYRDCHLEPDWLLIYKITDPGTLPEEYLSSNNTPRCGSQQEQGSCRKGKPIGNYKGSDNCRH